MALLIIGTAVWAAMHLIQFWGGGMRSGAIAKIGEGPWKGIFSLIMFGALALMIIGYRGAGSVEVWWPPEAFTYATVALMLFAWVLFIAAQVPGNIVRAKVRHPMLASVAVWGLAHLMVNGDLASVILFGGLLAWAVVERALLIKRDADKPMPEVAAGPKAWAPLLAGVVVFVIVLAIHPWLFGVSPLPV